MRVRHLVKLYECYRKYSSHVSKQRSGSRPNFRQCIELIVSGIYSNIRPTSLICGLTRIDPNTSCSTCTLSVKDAKRRNIEGEMWEHVTVSLPQWRRLTMKDELEWMHDEAREPIVRSHPGRTEANIEHIRKNYLIGDSNPVPPVCK